MPIQQITLEDFARLTIEKFGREFPWHKAAFKKPPEYFVQKLAATFAEDLDDLGYIHRAFFEVKQGLCFSLSRYKNSPEQSMTVLEMAKAASINDVAIVVAELKSACDLKSEDIAIL